MDQVTHKKAIRIDDEHIIQEPLLHDAEVVSLSRKRDKVGDISLEVSLMSESGIPLQMKLQGIRTLRCDSFMAQNVVLHVVLKKGVDATADVAEAADLFYLDETQTSQLATEILKGDLAFVHFIPSLGCEILAICKDVELFEGH